MPDSGIDLADLTAAFCDGDGTLPDCVAEGSSPGDWEAIFSLIRARQWRAVWRTDGGDIPLPPSPAPFLRHQNPVAVWPAHGLQVNFFPGQDIRFDFDRRELRSQARADAPCDLISSIGRTLGTPVLACYEGSARAFLRYDPANDQSRLA